MLDIDVHVLVIDYRDIAHEPDGIKRPDLIMLVTYCHQAFLHRLLLPFGQGISELEPNSYRMPTAFRSRSLIQPPMIKYGNLIIEHIKIYTEISWPTQWRGQRIRT